MSCSFLVSTFYYSFGLQALPEAVSNPIQDHSQVSACHPQNLTQFLNREALNFTQIGMRPSDASDLKAEGVNLPRAG